MSKLHKRYPGAAVVTGASAGIGAAFAHALAKEGFELVLVARRKAQLESLAHDLHRAHKAKVHVVAHDLAAAEGPARVKHDTDKLGIEVGFLVNNAGFGSWGLFHELDHAAEAKMIDLNCRGVMLMTAQYAPEMVKRKRGAIVITASTAAFQPTPFFATYGATKVFDLAFASALWAELKPHGVDVTAICPGYTKTEFQEVAGIHKEFSGPWRSPEQVVASCLANLGKGPTVIDGWLNAISARSVRYLPERLQIAFAYNILKRANG